MEISSSKVQLSGYFAWIWNIGQIYRRYPTMMVWKRWLRLVWAVMLGCSRRIPVENYSYCTQCGWSSISQSRVCIYESLYIYIYCWRQKCLEPRIIYIYLCINTCLHTHEMQMYLYDIKFGSITAYISPPVLHTNCFIASSAQILGRFFSDPQKLTSSQVFRAPPEVTPSISPGMDGWQKVGKSWVGRFMDPGHVEKKRPDFQGVFATNILSVFGIGIIHVSTYVQHELNVRCTPIHKKKGWLIWPPEWHHNFESAMFLLLWSSKWPS